MRKYKTRRRYLLMILIIYSAFLITYQDWKIRSLTSRLNIVQNDVTRIDQREIQIIERESSAAVVSFIHTYDYDKSYISCNPQSPYKHYMVENPDKHKKKIYTIYTAVTSRSSLQYKLLNMDIDGDGKPDRYTDLESGVRVVQDKNGVWRFCVAVGTYWAGGEIGRLIDFVMENGSILPCVTCDVKQNRHTMNGEGKYGYMANDLIEFYIDPSKRSIVDSYDGIKLLYKSGDVSYTREEFMGAVTEVLVYDEYIEGFEDQKR